MTTSSPKLPVNLFLSHHRPNDASSYDPAVSLSWNSEHWIAINSDGASSDKVTSSHSSIDSNEYTTEDEEEDNTPTIKQVTITGCIIFLTIFLL